MRSLLASPTRSLLHPLAVGGLLSLLLTGCGPDKPESGSTSNTPPPSPSTSAQTTPPPANSPTTAGGDFKVALVMSGPTSDHGWNAGAAAALNAVKAELHLSNDAVGSVESQTSAADQEKSLRDFAAKKYTVVFGHGTEYEAPALKIEKDFPNTLFVISAGSKVGHNTMPIVFQLEDGAYLEGMLAAAMSKTGKIASVGAVKDSSLEHVFSAFERGAKSVNPKIDVLPPVYTGDWDNVNLAESATLALIDQGADVIMQDVDSAAQGVFHAVQERNKAGKHVWALGTNGNQNNAAPDVILASAPIYTDKAFVAIAKAAKAGTLTANDKPFGMKEGVIDFVLNEKLASQIPTDVQSKLKDTQAQITAGKLDVTKATP